MVKNKKGGKNHKRLGRKNIKNDEEENKKTRFAVEDDEMYAQVTKLFGHGMVEVLCNDMVTRLCIIRKKFKRRKGSNFVDNGSILLVGLRSWELLSKGKREKCDLLHVYDKNEYGRLLKKNNFNLSLNKDKDDDNTNNDVNLHVKDDIFDYNDNNVIDDNENNVETDKSSEEDDIDIDMI